jgi:hypothetical protein
MPGGVDHYCLSLPWGGDFIFHRWRPSQDIPTNILDVCVSERQRSGYVRSVCSTPLPLLIMDLTIV